MIPVAGPPELGSVQRRRVSRREAVARGRGVADALVREVIRWAREQRATKLVLGVVEDNARARSLYRRLGFVDAGPRFPNEPGAMEQQMVLALEGGSP